jgi:hypothetical protein
MFKVDAISETYELPLSDHEWTVFMLQGSDDINCLVDTMDSGALTPAQRDALIRRFNLWVAQNLDKFDVDFRTTDDTELCAIMTCKQFPDFRYHVYDEAFDRKLWEIIVQNADSK